MTDCLGVTHNANLRSSTDDLIRCALRLIADGHDIAAAGAPTVANLAGVRVTAGEFFPIGTCRSCMIEAIVVLAAVAATVTPEVDRAPAAARLRRDILDRAR